MEEEKWYKNVLLLLLLFTAIISIGFNIYFSWFKEYDTITIRESPVIYMANSEQLESIFNYPQVKISTPLTPYGYIRADLWDEVVTGNTNLLLIMNDQNRIIDILQEELKKNNIKIPNIEYETFDIPMKQTGENTSESQNHIYQLPPFVVDENGTWYFEGEEGYEEAETKVRNNIIQSIHEKYPEYSIEEIEGWVRN